MEYCCRTNIRVIIYRATESATKHHFPFILIRVNNLTSVQKERCRENNILCVKQRELSIWSCGVAARAKGICIWQRGVATRGPEQRELGIWSRDVAARAKETQYLITWCRSQSSYMTIWKASYLIGGVFHWKCFCTWYPKKGFKIKSQITNKSISPFP